MRGLELGECGEHVKYQDALRNLPVGCPRLRQFDRGVGKIAATLVPVD
jgi:hypothetical protein